MTVVYYIQVADTVKIGTSKDINLRRQTLRCGTPSVLLATEPGSYELEQQRHREFAHLRLVNEVFRLAPDLLRHIASLDCMPQMLSTAGPMKPTILVRTETHYLVKDVICKRCDAVMGEADEYRTLPVEF